MRELSKEVTHNLWRTVEDGAGLLNVLVTISATTRGDSPSNLTNWEEDLDLKKANWIEEYVSLKISVANYFHFFNSLIFFRKSKMPSKKLRMLANYW